MPQPDVVKFLSAARASAAMRARYHQRNLAQLVFHAKNDGYDFSADDLADVVGKLEWNVIVNKDRDPFDETSSLWREMWGRTHFEYLLTSVVSRHSDEELRQLVEAS